MNQDGKDERIDQELGRNQDSLRRRSGYGYLNQDGKDKRMGQDVDLNQDGEDGRMGQDLDLNLDFNFLISAPCRGEIILAMIFQMDYPFRG